MKTVEIYSIFPVLGVVLGQICSQYHLLDPLLDFVFRHYDIVYLTVTKLT